MHAHGTQSRSNVQGNNYHNHQAHYTLQQRNIPGQPIQWSSTEHSGVPCSQSHAQTVVCSMPGSQRHSTCPTGGSRILGLVPVGTACSCGLWHDKDGRNGDETRKGVMHCLCQGNHKGHDNRKPSAPLHIILCLHGQWTTPVHGCRRDSRRN